MRERLHELRTQDDPRYRFHRAKPVALSCPSEPVAASSTLQSLDDEGYRRLLALADRRLAEAVDALYEVDAAFAEGYVERSAQNHMAACLRWIRAQENPSERAALVTEVNRLRASVGLGPMTWDSLVTVPPVAPRSSREG